MQSLSSFHAGAPRPRLIMGIETSCDETSVAILDGDGRVLSNLIASQIERHRPYGGVVPEIASREHLKHLMPMVGEATRAAGVGLADLEAIAVTAGPGLIGALLVGVAAAQGIAWGRRLPLHPVNHLEGHIFSPYLNLEGEATPLPARFFSLVVSGGHSSIYDVRTDGAIRLSTLNRTRDDAAGEVFDKVAKFLGFPYPGGPHIESTARGASNGKFAFPVARFKDGSIDFSFSGVKANAIRAARLEGFEGLASRDGAAALAGFCHAFQEAIVGQLIDRLSAAWDMVQSKIDRPSEIAIAGGVAANGALREAVEAWGRKRGVTVRLPSKIYCTDNAAMIAFAALVINEPADAPSRIPARSRVAVGTR